MTRRDLWCSRSSRIGVGVWSCQPISWVAGWPSSSTGAVSWPIQFGAPRWVCKRTTTSRLYVRIVLRTWWLGYHHLHYSIVRSHYPSSRSTPSPWGYRSSIIWSMVYSRSGHSITPWWVSVWYRICWYPTWTTIVPRRTPLSDHNSSGARWWSYLVISCSSTSPCTLHPHWIGMSIVYCSPHPRRGCRRSG